MDIFKKVVKARLNPNTTEKQMTILILDARKQAYDMYWKNKISFTEYKNLLDYYNLGITEPFIPIEERKIKKIGASYGDPNARDNLIHMTEKIRLKSIARRKLRGGFSWSDIKENFSKYAIPALSTIALYNVYDNWNKSDY